MGKKMFVMWITAYMLLAPSPGMLAAEMEHGGMHGMHGGHDGQHDHNGHGGMNAGERIFSGEIGPWAGEARLIEKSAYMEQIGISPKIAARFAGERHLMIFLSDKATGKPVSVAAGQVVITGPDDTSSSRVALVAMGGHIGADVDLSKPGLYKFTAEFESDGRKENVTFTHVMK